MGKNLLGIIEPPSVKEVEKWLGLWEKDNAFKHYHQQCKCLDFLFRDKAGFSDNTNFEKVLAKVAVLNDFYSTNIYKPTEVAQRIIDYKEKKHKDFDSDLREGKKELVDIVRGKIEDETTDDGKVIDCYSFATKYCSFHNPNKYQIYDSFCEKVLEYWLNKDKTAFLDILKEVKKTEKKDKNRTLFGNYCRDYGSYMKVIDAFIKHYKLDEFNRTDIDRYIWLTGKYYFPNKYEISAKKLVEKIKGLKSKEYSSNIKIKNISQVEDVSDIKDAINYLAEQSAKIPRILKLSGLGSFKKEFNDLAKKYQPRSNDKFVFVLE